MNKIKLALAMSVLLISNIVLADLNTGLVAYYPFNGNSNDESGNGNNGIPYGALLVNNTVSNLNGAYSFLGQDDYIEIPDNSSLNLNKEFTVSIRVNLQDWSYGWYGDGGWIISKTQSFDNDSMWKLEALSCQENCKATGPKYSSPKFLFAVQSEDGNRHTVISNQNIEKNVDYMVTVTGTKDNLLLMYINGQLDNAAIYNAKQKPNSYPVWIGAHYGISNRQINGVLDDVRIYNRTLASNEIKALYSNLSIVNGAVAWAKLPYSVQCKNNTSSKSVAIPKNTTANYDCEKAGLVVKSGDDISVTVRGKKY